MFTAEVTPHAYGFPRGDDPLLRLLVQNASDIVTVLDADGTIRYINLAVERALGYRPEELVGTCVLDMVHPDDLERSQQNLAENLANPGLRPPSTFRMPHKDGSWRHFEHVVNNLLEDPDVGGLVVSSRDVTERREAEEGHRESKERYRTLVERIPAVTYVQQANAPNAVTFVSPQMGDLLGYGPEECTSDPEHWVKITHPDDRDRVEAEDLRTNETGEPFAMTYRQFAKDGRTVWIRDEATLVRGEEGGAPYWLGIQTDVTERKEAEEAQRRLAAIVESSEYAVMSMTLDGTVTSWNPGAERLFGYPAEEIVGRRVSVLIPPERRGEVREAAEKMERGERVEHLETVRMTKEGRRIDVSLGLSPIYGPAGEVVGASAIAHDITERKEAEEALKESEERHRLAARATNEVIWDNDLRSGAQKWAGALQAMLGYSSKGFTDEERAAMRERAKEQKAEARANKNRAEGESNVLAKIAEMQEPDRAMAQRLHEIVKASAPALWPKTWYGMPAYAEASSFTEERFYVVAAGYMAASRYSLPG